MRLGQKNGFPIKKRVISARVVSSFTSEYVFKDINSASNFDCCNTIMVDIQPNAAGQHPNSKWFNGAHKTMFPAKNSHHSPKNAHNEENKTINFRMFLCGLNEKKRLIAQSIQNSIIWCPISITKEIFMFCLV